MTSPKTTGTQRGLLIALYWLAPTLFFVWFYRYGLKSWFMADDFAWLGLSQRIDSFSDFLQMMFEPMAQGTIRPWSERGFFLLFRTLFDLDSLPYRICVFATMSLDLVLITAVTLRITRSRLAGFLAPVFWTLNEALVTVMTWNSAYNEAQCAAFLLGSLLLFIRFAESGRKSLYWWTVAVFVLGFGALEINVVFPAIALCYVVFAAPEEKRRELSLRTIPLWIISIAYFLAHRAVAPFLSKGPYALHVDWRMVQTLLRYANWSLIPSTWDDMNYQPWVATAIVCVTSLGLVAFLAGSLRRRNRTPLLFLGWFLATIAPVIPLPDHISDYYLTVPTIGMAMLGAWAVAEGWRSSVVWKSIAVIAAASYCCGMFPVTRFATRWWSDRTRVVRNLVLGTRAAKEKHPDKAILIDGVTSELYNDAIGHSPFVLFGAHDVYLVPQSRGRIHPESDLAELDDTVLAPATTMRALDNDQALVYTISGDHLRNVTRTYVVALQLAYPEKSLAQEEPRRIDVANPLFSYLLGPEWQPIETNYRWMPKRATLKLGGMRTAKDQLFLEGSSPIRKLTGHSVHLKISVDGFLLPETEIFDPNGSFQRLFTLPSNLIGRDTVTISIETDQVTSTGGRGELGLVFGKIAIREP